MKYRLAIVEWTDAYASAGWRPKECFDGNTGVPVRTVGWLTQNDKEGVTVISGHAGDQSVALSFIPRGMVEKIHLLPDKWSISDNG